MPHCQMKLHIQLVSSWKVYAKRRSVWLLLVKRFCSGMPRADTASS